MRSYAKDVVAMADFLMKQLAGLGIKAEKRSIGSHQLDGQEIDLPPVIIGETNYDPKKAGLLLLFKLVAN